MLQRAASNAYSWWWASHIRTKQSKWLEQNLQDMEEKVQNMLKLIEEDGDSFAKRAEMYYKKRPELINFVEESYRAYRALAERYEHISTELQNANNTIASVFPEQVQFAMDDEDEDRRRRFRKKPPDAPKSNVPDAPTKDLKALFVSAAKKLQPKKSTKVESITKSGLSKPEALEKIDKLQKEILALQTEKEFVKSSYDSGLAKFKEIEKQIIEMQQQISGLQDEFGSGKVIEDDEARTVMAVAALKSCHETLAQLQEKQKRSAEEARAEQERIKDAREKLESMKEKFLPNQTGKKEAYCKANLVKEREKLNSTIGEEGKGNVTEAGQELELLREKIKEHFEVGSGASSLTVTELAEKIDELVNKVIRLETPVISQSVLVTRLRTESNELHTQLRSLEDEKEILIDGTSNVSNRLREMEEKLNGIQDLNLSIEDQNTNIQKHFTEAHCNLDHLSEKLHSVKPDKELVTDLSESEKGSLGEVELQKDFQRDEDPQGHKQEILKLEATSPFKKEEGSLVEEDKSLRDSEGQEETQKHRDGSEETRDVKAGVGENMKEDDSNPITSCQDLKPQDKVESKEEATGQQDEPNLQELAVNGIEGREKVSSSEYNAVLRNYEEVKQKLSDVENKTQDNVLETTVQLRELKSSNAMKDVEIRSLRQKISLMQTSFGTNKDLHESNLLDDQIGAPLPAEKEVNEDGIKVIMTDQPETISAVEEQLRMSIDELLEKNLDFWLRFSTTIHEIQKFESGVKDLQAEITKLEEKLKKHEGSSSTKYYLKSDVRPIYKHLREIETELNIWVEKSESLKDEMKSRFASLCDIQEEITKALKTSAEDEEFKFTSYQAAKFQGEVLNMKQENNKVADELQAGLDHVTTLQIEVEKTLAKLDEDFGIGGSRNSGSTQQKDSESGTGVPLRSFIFGVKAKKQKPSIFSCVTPALQRKYNALRTGV